MNSSKKSTCPGHDVFVRAFMKECTPAETERLVTHVMSCPPCWEKFQAMRRVGPELADLETGRSAVPPLRRLSVGLAAVFGSAIILLGAAFSLLRMDRTAALRGSGGGELVLLEPEGVLHSAPAVLRCTKVAGADNYAFKLIDEDLQTVFAGGGSEPRLALGAEIRAKLVKGKTYLWTVTVTDDESRIIEKNSKTFDLR